MSQQMEMKLENRNRVFHKIREEGSISRPEISRQLNLSLPTVAQNLNELLEMHLIRESGVIGNTGGRRAKAYSISAESVISIGLDIAQEEISIVVADLTGKMLEHEKKTVVYQRNDAYYRILGDYIAEIETKYPKSVILGVGIAVQCIVSHDYQTALFCKSMDMQGLTVAELGKYIPYPCRLYNDANAAGYAEITEWSDTKNMFYISLSDNIGGAVLVNDTLYYGDTPKSGEIGHIILHPDGKPCYCGQKGCFDAYCNASVLRKASGMRLDAFFARLSEGDADCVAHWNEYLAHLSLAIHAVRMLFDCKIVLGGYVGTYMEPYLDVLREQVIARNPFENNADYLDVCRVKTDALAYGSALPFIHAYWNDV